MTITAIHHIVVDDEGVARVAGNRIRVADIALEKIAWGMTPEQTCEGHPDLSLAQVHAALAHYYDHEAEFDASIKRELEEVERLREEAGESPFAARMRLAGKLT